jgi:hypothetical protein
VFDGICDQREVIVTEGREILLTIPQAPRGGELANSADRVEAGTTRLRDFVEAGLSERDGRSVVSLNNRTTRVHDSHLVTKRHDEASARNSSQCRGGVIVQLVRITE